MEDFLLNTIFSCTMSTIIGGIIGFAKDNIVEIGKTAISSITKINLG